MIVKFEGGSGGRFGMQQVRTLFPERVLPILKTVRIVSIECLQIHSTLKRKE